MWFAALVSYGQESEIKRVILDDLILLDSIYDGCIISPTQNRMIIQEADTLREYYSLNDIKNSYDSIVSIIQVDSSSSFILVEVRFKLMEQVSFSGLFSNNTFEYVLYKSKDKLLKVNGFFVSELLLIDYERPEYINRQVQLNAPKRFVKYFKMREVNKVRSYLTVEVLAKINTLGYQLNSHPFVKDVVCEAGI